MTMVGKKLLPAPNTLGLPKRFDIWRDKQAEAVVNALESDKRFVCLVMPTGAGKSLTAMAIANLFGGRAYYLTSTKGLQNQVGGDFAESGVIDIRGQNNYPCVFEDSKVTCDEGPCHAGMQCDKVSDGCAYWDAEHASLQSDLVVTNYSYWMHHVNSERGVGDVDLLILDEAHASVEELSSFLSVEMTPHEFEGHLGLDEMPEWEDIAKWKKESLGWSLRLSVEVETLTASYRRSAARPDRQQSRHVRGLKSTLKKLERLAGMQGEWVHETVRRGPMGGMVARFHPVWPGEYAEQTLFHGVGKIVLMSATVRPKTLNLLGLSDECVEFAEYGSTFPVARRPITFVPSVRVDKKMGQAERTQWSTKIDSIIGARLDRNGIIHTVSYERAHYLVRNSEWRDRMVMHDSKTTADVVKLFHTQRGKILVSPSMTTGWDFPGDAARYQIIAKVPFPDTRDIVLKARCARDSEYAFYIAMQTIVQSSGRAVRSKDDWAETFIVDDNWTWFWNRYKKFAPRWFAESVRFAKTIPQPLNFPEVKI